ncbi:uncharacterized protein RJT21DRAFT_114618 [Scheffersomyces amazonensis]|uniref:uncharacterized protein n=1 Tax=Scheffersomyces amazonensis TaxID=1078765 RepID=UPI00315D95E4
MSWSWSWSLSQKLSSRSLSTSFTRLNNISIAERPQFTGNGPFIELPEFNPIGSPSKLLNITLPQSSRLNIRHGSIVAINGDIGQLVSYTRSLTKFTTYQELHSQDSVSFIINGNNKNYTILNSESTTKPWTILNDENIIAWTGYNFQLEPIKVLEKFRSFQTSGKGTIVINGDNELFDINLNENESILLNPTSLIATDGKIQFKVINGENNTRIWNLLSSLKLPTFTLPTTGLIGSINNSITGNYNQFKHAIVKQTTSNDAVQWINKSWNQISSTINSAYHWIKLRLTGTIIKKKPIFVDIRGPARLIISNNTVISNHRLFTKSEIQSIYEVSK